MFNGAVHTPSDCGPNLLEETEQPVGGGSRKSHQNINGVPNAVRPNLKIYKRFT